MNPGRTLACVLTASLAVTCSHANRPCPTPRPFATRAPTRAPDDAQTAAAIAATGARYHACAEGSTYVIERPGARTLTEPELLDLRTALFSVPGAQSAGIGGCRCQPDEPTLGVVLWVNENSAAPAAVAEQVAAHVARAGGDPAACVAVTILSAPGPRCAAGDPACGPVPYEAACVERTDYDPKGKRTLVSARPGRGPCTHDGECVVAGCGNECLPSSEVGGSGTCEGRIGWENVYCGCLEQKCVWFTTR